MRPSPVLSGLKETLSPSSAALGKASIRCIGIFIEFYVFIAERATISEPQNGMNHVSSWIIIVIRSHKSSASAVIQVDSQRIHRYLCWKSLSMSSPDNGNHNDVGQPA